MKVTVGRTRATAELEGAALQLGLRVNCFQSDCVGLWVRALDGECLYMFMDVMVWGINTEIDGLL